jgi:hypothetical protein
LDAEYEDDIFKHNFSLLHLALNEVDEDALQDQDKVILLKPQYFSWFGAAPFFMLLIPSDATIDIPILFDVYSRPCIGKTALDSVTRLAAKEANERRVNNAVVTFIFPVPFPLPLDDFVSKLSVTQTFPVGKKRSMNKRFRKTLPKGKVQRQMYILMIVDFLYSITCVPRKLLSSKTPNTTINMARAT